MSTDIANKKYCQSSRVVPRIENRDYKALVHCHDSEYHGRDHGDHRSATSLHLGREVEAEENRGETENLGPNEARAETPADELCRGRRGDQQGRDQQGPDYLDHAHYDSSRGHDEEQAYRSGRQSLDLGGQGVDRDRQQSVVEK